MPLLNSVLHVVWPILAKQSIWPNIWGGNSVKIPILSTLATPMDVFYLLFVILNRVIRFGHVKTLFHSWSLIIWTCHTFWAHIWISYFESSLHGINIFWLTFTTWKDSGQRVFWPREILFFNNFLVSHSTFFIAMCFSLFFVHFPTFSNVVLGVAWRAYLHIIFFHTLLLIQLPPPFTGFFFPFYSCFGWISSLNVFCDTSYSHSYTL